MCNETMSPAEYNQMVLDNMNSEGSTAQGSCPECEKLALKKNFERCLGGSINQYYTLNCEHCSHHECDQEYCHICEQSYLEPIGYKEAPNVELIVDSLLDSLREKALIDPVSWSFLKLYTLKTPELVGWYDTFCIDDGNNINTPSGLFHYLKMQLLNERFSIWLNAG